VQSIVRDDGEIHEDALREVEVDNNILLHDLVEVTVVTKLSN